LHAGLTTLPWSLGGMVSMGASQDLLGKWGPRRVMQAGVAVMAAGLLGIAWTIHHLGISVISWDLAPALFTAGFGMGWCSPRCSAPCSRRWKTTR